MKLSPLKICDYCKSGIGVFTYESPALPGQYCTSDCYSDALIDHLGTDGLKGRFKLKTDGHKGVLLVP